MSIRSLPLGAAGRSRSAAGFSLIELLISLFVTVILIVGALTIFDFTNKLSQTQSQITEMQQNLRAGQGELVREIRMTGRGGLPGGVWPRGIGLQVIKNVPVGTHIAPTDAASPLVVPGTDVLVVRGVFSSPLYQVAYKSPGRFVLRDVEDPANPEPDPRLSETGLAHVCERDPSGAFDQTLQPLRDLIADPDPANANEALVIVSPVDDGRYGVVEFDPANSLPTSTLCNPADATAGVTVAFRIVSEDVNVNGGAGTARSDIYRRLSPAVPNQNLQENMNSIYTLGIVEEYRYYIRDETAGLFVGQTGNLPAPRLTRARVFPNTDVAHRGSSENLRVDIADNILDLQIALGIDRDGDEMATDAGSDTDEWLYNDAADDDTVAGNWGTRPVKYLRVTTVIRSDRADLKYIAPLMTSTEDHVYTSTYFPNTETGRKFRRRILQTVIDLRNMG